MLSFELSNLACSCEHFLFFSYFLDQPDNGCIVAKTCSWLYLINKSCVRTEYIVLVVVNVNCLTRKMKLNIPLIVNFIFVVPCIINLFYVSNQRDAVLSSPFIVLKNHSTCFGCPLHPSSGVHKTVVTTTGTSHRTPEICRVILQ